MKLFYRGLAHEYNPYGVAAIPQGGMTYRGLDWRFPTTTKVRKSIYLPATAELRYRGVAMNETVTTAPVTATASVPAPTAAVTPLIPTTARSLMLHQRWDVRNRHRAMLNRVLSKMGLKPSHTAGQEQSIHLQGNWGDYERAHASLS
ncbi:MAG: hypothetical protein OHK0012_04040 [Synechococcales cyanobacterium]